MGAIISALIWQSLRVAQTDELARRGDALARSLAGAIETRIDEVYTSLQSGAEFWESLLQRDPESWHQAARIFLHDHPFVVALVQTDPVSGQTEVEAPPDGLWIVGELLPNLPAVETGAAAAESDRLLGPLPLSDGRHVFALRRKVALDPEGPPRTLLAVIDPRALLERIDAQAARELALRVEVDGVEIFRARGAADPPAEPERTVSVTPSLGKPWTLAFAPGALGAPAEERQGALLVLGAGLLISALLSSIVYVGTLSARRARALATINAELREQVKDARRGEVELKQLSDELEARVRDRTTTLHDTIVELETFNYSVSHDLRSPLGAISNFAAILAEDYRGVLDATGRGYLDRIVQCAQDAASMMDALIAYSRSGSQTLQKGPVDMKRLAQETAAEITAARPQPGCEIQIRDLPEAWADESMMRSVLSNLLSNACKFVRPGEAPKVEISGQLGADEVVYCVRDQGVGFDMRYADKLFQVFERLHPADEYEGHGVGMAIVARLVRRHGGKLWAQGAVDKGASFYFSLPTRRSEDGTARA
jgi:signal transduction histidine kinase